jgi:acetylornithine deacetylase/succinyl-diaminopimelate desuccinylase family protein
MSTVETTKTLISYDTSGPPAKELPLAKWIKDYLEDIGAETELQVVDKDRANVIGKIGAGKGPGLLLSGHIDVVLAGDPSLWKVTTPFEGKIKGDKLYGRGACDMKGPDACLLEAAKALSKEKYKRQLTLAFTAGEDTGGWFVTKVIAEGKITKKDARMGIIPEPSMMDVIRAHKGAGHVKIMVHGKAAHSSRPELGINAIDKAADVLVEMRKLQKTLNKKPHPLLGPTTAECTISNGGFKANIIPDQCTLDISTRLIPGHEKPAVSKGWFNEIIKALKAKDPKFKAEILEVTASKPLDVPENSEIVRLLAKMLKKQPSGAPYYTEAVNYTAAGIPTVICGPGNIDQAHTPDEYITLKQLDLGLKTFKETIRQVCLI